MAELNLAVKLSLPPGPRQILRVSRDPDVPFTERGHTALILSGEFDPLVSSDDFGALLSFDQSHDKVVRLPQQFDYLQTGDIVRLHPEARIMRAIYRANSSHNVLFITERCNSRCVMCSQPPRDVDDGYLIEDLLKAIPLMDKATRFLCITGGEPTLNMEGLLKIIREVKVRLPGTSLHMLSNGRTFQYLHQAKAIASLSHSDLTIGIPLYSDLPSQHDFVVQAKGAFDETILGLMNLARHQQRVEIRVVIHKLTVDRLPEVARFIGRNLPFASHVALMGLEPTGFGKTNLAGLRADPWDYREQLTETVHRLVDDKINVSIYNHPLCLLPSELWKYARKSISDWKNVYLKECQKCEVRDQCCGFFTSAKNFHSNFVKSISRKIEFK